MTRGRPVERCRGDRGFTLPELLVTIALMGIVIPALVAAIIVSLRTTGAAGDRFAESYDSELLVNYFVPDAQSANIVGTNDLDTPCDALEQPNDIMRMLGLRFASGYRRVDLDPGDGLAQYVIQRWSAPLEDTNGDGVPECGNSGRVHVVAERIRNVTAFSDSERQVALDITTTSGHHYSVSASARTGTIDLNHRPRIDSMTVTCHNLECVGNASWSDVEDGPDLDAVWDWGDGTPLTSSGEHEYTEPGGTFTVTLTVTDDAGAQARASQEVTVKANLAPIAVDDAYETNEDSPLDVAAPGVLGNDIDADPMFATLDTSPAHGTLTFNPDGSFRYTPAADYNGLDTFAYHATDVDGAESAPATVSITVLAANDPPFAVPDAYTTDEDTLLDVAPSGVLANDSDVDNDPLTAVLVTGPSHGTLEIFPDGSFRYAPVHNYNGLDTFTYRADDGEETSNAVTVSVTVTPVNDGPPVAVDDSYSAVEDTPLTVPAPGVLANDSDPDDDPMTAINASDPSHGSVTLNGNGSFSYTPDPNYFGPDSFTYQASDGTPPGAPATVSITVAAVNDRPVANSETYSVYEDEVLVVAPDGVLGNDTDVDGPALIAQRVALPQHGSLVFSADGSFTYTPFPNFFGLDSFTYFASDGSAVSDTVTVTINVVPNPINDGPEAGDDSYNATEDTPLTVPAPGVLANDTDVDNDPLTASSPSTPAHGVVTLNTDGSFTYTPVADYSGPDSFTYVVSDPNGGTDTGTVTIDVAGVNDAPVATADSYTVAEDTPLSPASPGVLGNDTDVDNPTLTVATPRPVAGPSHGSLTLNADGSFTYTPATNYSGADSFSYRATDGLATSNLVAVSITVTPVNDPPVAVNDSYTTRRNQQLVVPVSGVLGNDTDVENNPLTAVIRSFPNPAEGSVTLNADGSFSFTPATNFSGTASFTYWANDGTTNSTAFGSVTIRVNRPPTASIAVGYCTTDIDPCSWNLSVSGSGSSDTDGTIASYSWSWGDGTPAGSGVTSNHTYTAGGARTITLTVTDNDGDTATATATATPPVLTFTTRTSCFLIFCTYYVDLAWSGVPGSSVVVIRNGSTIDTNDPNDGAFTRSSGNRNDVVGTYWICERGSGTRRCTNSVTVTSGDF